MARQKIEIEIDIPEGWEFVRYGLPKANDNYLIQNEIIFTPRDHPARCDPQVIVRRAWQQPDFLKPGWIAMDSYGEWFWFEDEPKIDEDFQWWFGTEFSKELDLTLLNFTAPPCDDWRTSKRRIV